MTDYQPGDEAGIKSATFTVEGIILTDGCGQKWGSIA